MKQAEAELRQLTLEDLWTLLRRNLLPVVLAAVVALSAVLAANWLLPARYRATATLYILYQEDESCQTSEDFNLALKMINDCTYLLKSHAVLDPVIGELGLDMDYRGRNCSWSMTSFMTASPPATPPTPVFWR